MIYHLWSTYIHRHAIISQGVLSPKRCFRREYICSETLDGWGNTHQSKTRGQVKKWVWVSCHFRCLVSLYAFCVHAVSITNSLNTPNQKYDKQNVPKHLAPSAWLRFWAVAVVPRTNQTVSCSFSCRVEVGGPKEAAGTQQQVGHRIAP